MKNLYILEGVGVQVEENGELTRIDSEYEGISRIFVATEPTHIVYKNGGVRQEVDADTNDIVITFYRDEIPNKVIVAKSDKWLENLKSYREFLQEQKEKWAKEKAESSTPCDRSEC